jgi:lipopolysaccharide assembly protein A
MRVLAWAIRIALFVLLVAFAAKNADPVKLRFYFDLAWEAPLVALLLAFFAAGVLLGVLAMLGTFLAQRREVARLERKILIQEPKSGITNANQPPAAEG